MGDLNDNKINEEIQKNVEIMDKKIPNKSVRIKEVTDKWDARKKCKMDHSKEAWDERAQRWHKELTEEGEMKERNKRRVSATIKFLKENGALEPGFEVIDIGCGPGRFVAAFAKEVAKATGTDLSSEMCRYGKEYAESVGCLNTEFVPVNFKEADVDELGWKKKFDLVFSSITPAMNNYASMLKAESMSRKFCFECNYVDFYEPFAEEIIKEVLPDVEIKHKRNGETFNAMINIIRIKGYKHVTDFYKESAKQEYYADDKTAEDILGNTEYEAGAEEIEKIKEAVKRHAGDKECVVAEVIWTYECVLWEV